MVQKYQEGGIACHIHRVLQTAAYCARLDSRRRFLCCYSTSPLSSPPCQCHNAPGRLVVPSLRNLRQGVSGLEPLPRRRASSTRQTTSPPIERPNDDSEDTLRGREETRATVSPRPTKTSAGLQTLYAIHAEQRPFSRSTAAAFL